MSKEFKKWVKKTEKSNKAFKLMTKAEKRVQIAQDVIDRIKLRKIEAGSGTLMRSSTVDGLHSIGEDSLKKAINSGVSCSVCAKGGLFIAYVGRVNKFNTSDLGGNGYLPHMHESNEMQKLQELFSGNQLALIEMVFEGDLILKEDYNFSERQVNRARGIYIKFRDSNDRLTAICENIIHNKGSFKL
jgi:hypothetical protein